LLLMNRDRHSVWPRLQFVSRRRFGESPVGSPKYYGVGTPVIESD
jgi:hypothetical protein